MTELRNQEGLNAALNTYKLAMCKFIFEYLEDKVQGETVEELIKRALGGELRDIGIKGISRIFNHRDCWSLFSQRFGYNRELKRDEYDIRSMTRLAVIARNKVSHTGTMDLDHEFTRAHLFFIADVLEKIGRSDAKREVEEIRKRLFSHETEEPLLKSEIAAYKEHIADMTQQLETSNTEKTELEKQVKTTSDRLKEAEAERLAYDARLETASIKLKIAVAGKTVAEERLSDISNRLESMEAENADMKTENDELKERLSETENPPKVIELESNKHIKTLMDKTELEERYETTSIKEWRRKFWEQLCDYAAQKDTPIRFNKPSSENYLNVSRTLIDLTGFRMNVWLGKNNRKIAIRLYMSEQNFDLLEEQQKEIEQEFCESLEWEKLPQRPENRISLRKDIIDSTDESDWENHHEWVISKLEKFHKKFDEVFLPRIQELNTSDSLSEDKEDLLLNPATPNSVTFQGTPFTKRLNKYRVEGAEITQNFWHYWHAQGPEGKEEMRNAGWNVEKVNGDWEIAISPKDFQAWIESEVTELSNLFNASNNEEQPPQPVRPVYERTILPTGKEMEQPALELLADRKEHRRVEIINCLTEYFSLTDDARSYLSKTGQAEKHLVNKGLIKRTRTGYYRITPRGLQVLR